MKITPIKIAVTVIISVLMTIAMGKIIIIYSLLSGIIASLIYSLVKRRCDLSFIAMAVIFSLMSVYCTYSIGPKNHHTINYISKYVTITGEIISAPQESNFNDNFKYKLKVSTISDRYNTIKSRETILLTTPAKIPCGAAVTVHGIVDELPSKLNENGFDTGAYYRSCDIFTRLFTENVLIDSTDSPSLYSLGGRIAEFIDGKIYKYYSGDGAAILSAILTGNTHHFSEEYSDVLSATTMTRLFHPAYLHIWLILALVGLTKKFVPRNFRDTLIILIFFTYAALQTGGIGFSRCLVCIGLATLFRLIYGSDYYPDTMATAVTLAVIAMPTIIFNAGFVLSVLGGMLVWAFAPYVTEKLVKVPRRLRRPLAVILVCMFLYTPFSTYYFNGLCVYSFVLPLITAPLVVCALVTGPISLILMELSGTAPVVSGYTDYVVNAFYELPYFISSLPLSHINIATPSTTTILAYLCGVMLLYYIIHKREKHIYCLSAILTGFILSITVLSFMRIGTAEFTFVNVDQGDGAIIHTPYKETIVIDGGGGNGWSGYNPGEIHFVPYLESKGYNRIETAIVSHYHQDHIEGVINMLNSVKTDTVIAPAVNEYYSDSMKEWAKKLETAAQSVGTEIRYISENTRVEFSDGLVIDIYYPDPILGKIDENDTTMPIKVHYGDFSVLYTGDMTKYGEYKFMNMADVSADVLKVPHHGSRDSSSDAFIKMVDPEISVISCGIDNVYAHPHNETLERLKDTTILRTDLMQDITITARKDGSYRIK